MLPPNCKFDEPFYITIIHWITGSISIPIYGIAFLVLLFKCPKHFNEYRNYLLAHIFSGFLLDYHIRIIWKLNVFFPWATLCSNSFAAQFSIHSFQIFVVILLSVGWTAVYLFIYRMKAATKHDVRHPTVQTTVIYLYYAFYAVSGVVMIFLVLIYEELRDQKEYKIGLEQVIIHLVFFFFPLCLHFTTHFIVVNNQNIAPFAVMMLQDHGTITTFTMIITNNLLRRATRNLFNCRRTEQQAIFESRNAIINGMAVLN
ncbi:unnamed protein product [Caenorhabditis brenneri]